MISNVLKLIKMLTIDMNSKSVNLFVHFIEFLTDRANKTKFAGSQKDRHRGTSGAKEGFSSIGRFSKKLRDVQQRAKETSFCK